MNKLQELEQNGEVIAAFKLLTGIPEDIKVQNYDTLTGEDAYFDISVGNLFAATYVNQAANTRLYVASKVEEGKRRKYGNMGNIIPLAMETTGGFGVEFKEVLKDLAKRIECRKNIPAEYLLHRIKAKLTAVLMKDNAEMVISSLIL